MNTKDILKLAASAPIAIASAGAGYLVASSGADAADERAAGLESQLQAASDSMQLLRETNKAYIYKLQKAENEIAVMKAREK